MKAKIQLKKHVGVENFNSFARQCDSFSCRCVHHFDTISTGLLINFRLLFALQDYITFPSFTFVPQKVKIKMFEKHTEKKCEKSFHK